METLIKNSLSEWSLTNFFLHHGIPLLSPLRFGSYSIQIVSREPLFNESRNTSNTPDDSLSTNDEGDTPPLFQRVQGLRRSHWRT